MRQRPLPPHRQYLQKRPLMRRLFRQRLKTSNVLALIIPFACRDREYSSMLDNKLLSRVKWLNGTGNKSGDETSDS